ncbi:hypothetical protein DFP73DRAFT_592215 [Morchella snyderi]|nr:hypothetical protein DFP73DRAFT_592215 [Morchella snyderi]
MILRSKVARQPAWEVDEDALHPRHSTIPRSKAARQTAWEVDEDPPSSFHDVKLPGKLRRMLCILVNPLSKAARQFAWEVDEDASSSLHEANLPIQVTGKLTRMYPRHLTK